MSTPAPDRHRKIPDGAKQCDPSVARTVSLLEALEGLYELCQNASADAFKNGVTDSTGTIDQGDVYASERMDRARIAIRKARGEL